MRRSAPASFPLSFAVLAVAGASLAPLSTLTSGCANGTSAITGTFDASTPGDDDDVTMPVTPGDDDDQDASVADSSTGDDDATSATDAAGGSDATSGADGGGTTDAAAPDGGPTTCAAALALAQYTFDNGSQGWTHGVSDGQGTDWPFDPWTQGTAVSGSPACPEGACFGAELTENYAQCQRGYLLSPVIDVSKCAGQSLQLNFQHGYSFWDDGTYFDGGVVLVSVDGTNWHTLDAENTFPGAIAIETDLNGYACDPGTFEVDGKAGYAGTSGGNVSVQLLIPSTLVTSQLQIKFSMGSGVNSETTDPNTSRKFKSSGWRVDNVGLSLP